MKELFWREVYIQGKVFYLPQERNKVDLSRRIEDATARDIIRKKRRRRSVCLAVEEFCLKEETKSLKNEDNIESIFIEQYRKSCNVRNMTTEQIDEVSRYLSVLPKFFFKTSADDEQMVRNLSKNKDFLKVLRVDKLSDRNLLRFLIHKGISLQELSNEQVSSVLLIAKQSLEDHPEKTDSALLRVMFYLKKKRLLRLKDRKVFTDLTTVLIRK